MAFGPNISFGNNEPLSFYADQKSNRLRDAFRSGQRVFRGILNSRGYVDGRDFADQLALIDDEEQREGFSMGWQSDHYATTHGMELSVMGNVRYEPEDLNESHKIKVDSGMVESNSD